MKISLILLTRNEIECLKLLYDKIPQPGADSGFDEVLAIDGGSTDGTVEFFSDKNIPIVGQSKRGRGEAFQIAISQLNSDAFIFFSPDGNESFDDIKKFRPLLEKGADIVIASRMMKESRNEEDDQIFKWRKWANNSFNFMANIFFRRQGAYVTDSINGFRAITKIAANKLNLDAPDYTIEYQMTIRALKSRLNIAEFPTIEGKRVAGETGAPSIPTGLRFIHRFFIELVRS